MKKEGTDMGGSDWRIDLTLEIDEDLWSTALKKTTMSAFGHLGTHIDIRDKEFPLGYCSLPGRMFDVRSVRGRDLEATDIPIQEIGEGVCVLFYTGHLNETRYGTEEYSKTHPQLSRSLIDALIGRNVRIIGIDAAGIRRGAEHSPTDQYCADRGVFVVENLANLDILKEEVQGSGFILNTFPLRLKGATGLPCRVIAEVE
jgi:kynurenine formamidase